MARFVALSFRFDGPRLLLGVAILMAGLMAPMRAQQPMMAQAPAGPVKTPPPAGTTPGVAPETLGQYGKILAAGDQPAHPLKLKLPFPDAGDVKIPSQDELIARDKLEQLAMLSDEDIRAQLNKWPAYGKMSLRDQGAMLVRIQDFRDYRSNVARGQAHDMGLLTLTPDQQARFEKEYWDKRLKMEHTLVNQFTPVLKAEQQKLRDELFREYSVVSQGPIAQGPKPPPAKPAPPKPVVAATNGMVQPVAQGPQ